jgi:hypothetical protein
MTAAKQGPSEFYRLSRFGIVDTAALLGFFLGFVGAGPFAFRFLVYGFSLFGDATTGVMQFIATILGAGSIGGAIGMALGTACANLWQRWHLHRRLRWKARTGLHG